MFGRGVILTQYARAFEKAGHTVEFYVRKGQKTELGPTVTLNVYDARKSVRGKLIKEVYGIISAIVENRK
jgi:2-dehydropantoate 2-reductase